VSTKQSPAPRPSARTIKLEIEKCLDTLRECNARLVELDARRLAAVEADPANELAGARERKEMVALQERIDGLKGRHADLVRAHGARVREEEAERHAEFFAAKEQQFHEIVELGGKLDDAVTELFRVHFRPFEEKVRAFARTMPEVPAGSGWDSGTLAGSMGVILSLRIYAESDGTIRPPGRTFETPYDVRMSARGSFRTSAENDGIVALRALRMTAPHDDPPAAA
jgi:hypothetical protein